MPAFLAILRGGVMAVAMTGMAVAFVEPYAVPDDWTDTPAAEVVPGGLLRFAVPGPPRTYNPLLSVETNLVVDLNTEATFGAAVLGWWRPDDGTLEPRAAESFEVSADGLTITIALRPELRWSDGVPITAQDYVISYGLQVNPETGAAGPERWTVGDALITVEASDTHSLVVRIPTFDRLAVQTVASHYPLPDHVFGHAYRTGGAEAVTTLWGTGTPPSELVFSGAMVVGEVREGERMTLARNPYFGEWNVDAAGRPLPYLDGMTFTYMEPFAQLNSFLAGDLDFFQARDIDELGVISTAVSNDGLDAVVHESVFPVEATYFFAFNLNLASDPFKQDLFRSPEFRRAVAHLVDRSSLVDLVYAGAGFPLRGSIPPTYAPWFDEDLDILEFDPESAVGLLEGLGFTSRDSDGVLIDAHGRRAGFTIIVPDAAEAELAATIFADTAREVGVDVRVQTLTFPLYVDMLTTHGDDRGFEVAYVALTPTDPAWPFPESVFSCTGALHVSNLSGACLSATERLVAELAQRGRTTLDDEEALLIAHRLLELDAWDSTKIYTVAPAAHLVRSGRVRGGFPRELWGPRTGFGWLFMNSVR